MTGMCEPSCARVAVAVRGKLRSGSEPSGEMTGMCEPSRARVAVAVRGELRSGSEPSGEMAPEITSAAR